MEFLCKVTAKTTKTKVKCQKTIHKTQFSTIFDIFTHLWKTTMWIFFDSEKLKPSSHTKPKKATPQTANARVARRAEYQSGASKYQKLLR